MNSPPIGYTIFTADNAGAMARLLAETFCRRDPPAVAAGLTAPDFEAFVQLLCPKAAAERLTILARDAATGELLGALLVEDSASAMPNGIDTLSSKFDPIFDILGELDAGYRAGRTPHPGESIHLFLLGVSETAAGRGVAQGLVTACLEHGARRGYRLAVAEATNTVSQHIFRKLGFTERVRASYADHRFEGRAVFASIAGQGGPILMDKIIGSRPSTTKAS
jgi:ribosomal protein S18 acetylase RimI-like enzyme